MTIWLDEQISPLLASWIEVTFGVACFSVINLPVNRSDDRDIFFSAREAGAVIVSKDSDFVDLVATLGAPPQIIWLTCGNRSNSFIKETLLAAFPRAVEMIFSGEPIVEIA